MKEIKELRTDHVCDQNYRHLDAYFDDDDNSEGKTVAMVDLDNDKVIFLDNAYRVNETVKQAIKDILDVKKMKGLLYAPVYIEEVFFDDVLKCNDELWKHFDALRDADKVRFMQKTFHSVRNGFAHGVPISDVISDVATNILSDIEKF